MKTTRILIMVVIALFFATSTFAGSKTLSSEKNGRSVEQKSSQKSSSNQNSYSKPQQSKPQQSKGNNDKYTGNHGNKDKGNSHGNSNGYTGNRSNDYKGKGDNHGSKNYGYHGPKNYGHEYDKYWSNYSPHLRPNYSHYGNYSVRIHTSPIYYGHRTCYCSYSHPLACQCSSCGYYKTIKEYVGKKRVFSHYENRFIGYDHVTRQVWVPEVRVNKPVKIGEFTVNVSVVVEPGHYDDVTEEIPRYEQVPQYTYVNEYRDVQIWTSTRPNRCYCYR